MVYEVYFVMMNSLSGNARRDFNFLDCYETQRHCELSLFTEEYDMALLGVQ